MNLSAAVVTAHVGAPEAVEFVQRWHYSQTCQHGVVRHGWFVEGELIGVSVYNLGNHAMRECVFGAEYASHVLHHHRLAVHPNVPHGHTSTFLAASLRLLSEERPDVWAVVTYADADQGHTGTIYQATNAQFTGITTKGNIYFVKPDGSISTTQSLKQVGNWGQRRAYARDQGWEERRSTGKYRYVYILGNRRAKRDYPQMLLPTFPYPKNPGVHTRSVSGPPSPQTIYCTGGRGTTPH